MQGFERVADHPVDLLLPLVHPHLTVLGEKLPDRILTNFQASVVKLFFRDLKIRELVSFQYSKQQVQQSTPRFKKPYLKLRVTRLELLAKT